jgi:Leucine Rich repeat
MQKISCLACGFALPSLIARNYHPPMPSDELQLATWLETLGARVRRRRDGSLHTVDFAGAPQAATDAVAARLREAPRLKALAFPRAPLTDAAADALSQLLELTELDLRETQVTDQGLELLKALSSLKVLQLTGAPVTREGVKKLRQALLNCRIVFLD